MISIEIKQSLLVLIPWHTNVLKAHDLAILIDHRVVNCPFLWELHQIKAIQDVIELIRCFRFLSDVQAERRLCWLLMVLPSKDYNCALRDLYCSRKKEKVKRILSQRVDALDIFMQQTNSLPFIS